MWPFWGKKVTVSIRDLFLIMCPDHHKWLIKGCFGLIFSHHNHNRILWLKSASAAANNETASFGKMCCIFLFLHLIFSDCISMWFFQVRGHYIIIIYQNKIKTFGWTRDTWEEYKKHQTIQSNVPKNSHKSKSGCQKLAMTLPQTTNIVWSLTYCSKSIFIWLTFRRQNYDHHQ